MKACFVLPAVLVLVVSSVRSDEKKVDPSPSKSISQLLKELGNKTDSDIRFDAAEALGKKGPAAKEAVSALIEALKDRDEDVRDAAAEALGLILKEAKAADAKAAVAALNEVLKDEKPGVRESAALSLGLIGREALP